MKTGNSAEQQEVYSQELVEQDRMYEAMLEEYMGLSSI
jgi:hypothetical protein